MISRISSFFDIIYMVLDLPTRNVEHGNPGNAKTKLKMSSNIFSQIYYNRQHIAKIDRRKALVENKVLQHR